MHFYGQKLEKIEYFSGFYGPPDQKSKSHIEENVLRNEKVNALYLFIFIYIVLLVKRAVCISGLVVSIQASHRGALGSNPTQLCMPLGQVRQ